MPGHPLVSVIVPAYNASHFIRETLHSVQSQTYTNIEIFVVDDGSQDHTLSLIQSIAEEDSRLQVLQQSNKGVAAARNLAIQQSTGEFIAPIDADDLWDPKKIELQVNLMLQVGSSLGLVYTWWISIDGLGTPYYTSPKWRIEGDVYKTLVALNFIGNASVPLFRRSIVEEVGGYNMQWREQDSQGCEDWDLSLRIAEKYQFGLVPEYLVKYRSVKGSMAGNFEAMKKSHELLIQNVKLRQPQIEEKVLGASVSNFYLYLAGVNYKSGLYRSAFQWASRAFFSSKASPWSIWTIGLILTSLPKVFVDFVRSILRGSHHR